MFPALRLLFVYVVLGVPAALIGIPWTLLRGNFQWMYRTGMAITGMGPRVAGVKVKVVGLENIPPGRACIFMSNHVSNLDAPILLPNVPGRTSIFLKKQLMSIPILGTAMRMGRYVPVSRGHSRDDATQSVEAATKVLQDGLHMTLFPEGTRSPDGKLLPFKKGGFFLAMESGAPIVPVVVKGTAAMMRKGSLKIHPGNAEVHFLPAVDPKHFEAREDLMQAVRDEMEKELEGSEQLTANS